MKINPLERVTRKQIQRFNTRNNQAKKWNSKLLGYNQSIQIANSFDNFGKNLVTTTETFNYSIKY